MITSGGKIGVPVESDDELVPGSLAPVEDTAADDSDAVKPTVDVSCASVDVVALVLAPPEVLGASRLLSLLAEAELFAPVLNGLLVVGSIEATVDVWLEPAVAEF